MINQRTPTIPFEPHTLLRAGSAQTLLAMMPPRNVDITRDERPMLLDAGYDHTGLELGQPVKLLGYYNASRVPGVRRGLALILHGWEGCSHSNYNRMLAQTLVEAGYDAFRLNLRDHGPGIHCSPYALNRGLFMAVLIEEAATATHRIAELAGDRPFYIMGASMGGNFALRLAIGHSREPIQNLRKVIAVCPAVNPARATDALDANPATRRYFRRRWLRSLRQKQALYPDLYDFAALEGIPLVRDMTEWFVREYAHLTDGRFEDADSYFHAYSTLGDAFADLTVCTSIITTMNDPVIPVGDFYGLAPHPLLDVQIHATGGHVGFMDGLPLRHRLPDLVMAELPRD